MADTDRTLLKKQQAAALAGNSDASDPVGEVGKAHRFIVRITKASDDAMASTTTSETYTGIRLPVKCQLVAAYVTDTGGTGLTGHASNYATLTISNRDSAAANKTTLVAFATSTPTTDDLAQGTPHSIFGDATLANVVCEANDTLTYEIAKAGSGVVFPASVIDLEFEAI